MSSGLIKIVLLRRWFCTAIRYRKHEDAALNTNKQNFALSKPLSQASLRLGSWKEVKKVEEEEKQEQRNNSIYLRKETGCKTLNFVK